MKVQIFLQSEVLDDVEVVEVDSDGGHKALREACLARVNYQPNEEFFLFVEDEDDVQATEKLDKVPQGLCVQLHRLKKIEVTVQYAGRPISRIFPPSATMKRVKKWATKELGITPSDAAELMLQINGTTDRPDSDIHIGTLVQKPNNSLTFDLVPSPRVNG